MLKNIIVPFKCFKENIIFLSLMVITKRSLHIYLRKIQEIHLQPQLHRLKEKKLASVKEAPFLGTFVEPLASTVSTALAFLLLYSMST